MLKTGKLDNHLLQKIVLDNLKFQRPEVLTRAGVGEDCAVVDFGDYECILSTDPITAAVNHIGRLAIHVSCNDIASNGAEPLGIMLAVMLPTGTTEAQVEEIMAQAGRTAEQLQVEIIGGHTEITPSVNQPVIVSTALGRVPKGFSQRAQHMRPGDLLLLTKAAALEGTGILACDFEEDLRGILTEAEMAEAKNMLTQVSVVAEGVTAAKVGTHGMHDVTEGGVLGALWEMCQVSRTGAKIQIENIPLHPVTQKVCRHFHLDPLRLISSGTMLIVVPPEKQAQMTKALSQIQIPATYIGQVTSAAEGIQMKEKGQWHPIAPPASDELYKVIKP